MTSDEAMEQLVRLLKRLFAGRIPQMKETPVRRRFEKDLFTALDQLQQEPNGTIDHLPIAVQRLVYEMITQYIMMYAQSPGLRLSFHIASDASDEIRLSALLRDELIPHSWPYPQSVPL